MNQSVLIIVASNKHTGVGRVALLHARLLREAGIRALFVAQPGGSLQETAQDAELWHESSISLPTRGQVWSLAADWLRLRRLIASENIGVIFCYRSTDHLLAALTTAGRVPIVRYFHDMTENPPIMPWNNWLLKPKYISHILAADLMTAVFADTLVFGQPGNVDSTPPAPNDTLFAADNERVTFTPGGVDTLHFTPDRGTNEVRAQLGLMDDNVVIGMVSRIKPGRGHDLFLRAFSLAALEEPHLRALLVGGGSDQDLKKIRDMADSLGIAGKVAIFEPGPRYESALAAIDIGCLIHPGSAGTGQAALELMSMARPMVVLRCGVFSVLLDGAVYSVPLPVSAKNGEYPADMPREFANHFLCLARNPDLRMEHGQASRAYMERFFSRGVLQEKLVRVCKLLDQKSPGR